LLLESSPVTTRRMSAAVPAEHANMIMTIDQTVLRIIASSLLCPNATCLAGLLSPSVASLATLARQTGNVRRYRQGLRRPVGVSVY
jgi:hypothetical protein